MAPTIARTKKNTSPSPSNACPEAYPEACTAFLGPRAAADILAAISTSAACSLDLETTALTPWTHPPVPGSSTKLGTGETLRAYKQRLGTTIYARPRARILSLAPFGERGEPLQQAFVLDLDLWVTPDAQAALRGILQAIEPLPLYGHNLSFDLAWLRHLHPAFRPTRIRDTMLLAMCFRPDFVALADDLGSGGQMHAERAPGLFMLDADTRKYAADFARQQAASGGGAGRLGLEPLARLVLGEHLDKAYQKPHNWMPQVLTTGHYAYCVGDVALLPNLARLLLGLPTGASEQTLDEYLHAERGSAPAYLVAIKALHVLTDMQRTGIRFDRDLAETYRLQKLLSAEQARVRVVSLAPELAPHLRPVHDLEAAADAGGLTRELKNAIAATLSRLHDVTLPTGADGSPAVANDTLVLACPGSEFVDAWQNYQQALRAADMAEQYAAACDPQGRIHALTTIAAATLRTTSQEPNSQNMPRDPDFRALFRAAPGNVVVASDFSAIEMRVAAALGVRAHKQLLVTLARMRAGEIDRLPAYWVWREPHRTKAVLDAAEGKPCTLAPESATPRRDADEKTRDYLDRLADHIAGSLCAAIAGLRAAGVPLQSTEDHLPLREVFRANLDPHLATALALAGWDTGGVAPVQFLAGLSAQQRAELKGQLKGPRQAAKAVNFGLAYRMSALSLHRYGVLNYGLTWSPDEARSARAAWFQLYPEIAVWHWFSEHAGKVKHKTGRPDSGGHGKVFIARTLSGRLCAAPTVQGITAYMDQGTAAEIAHRALAALPPRTAQYLVGFVHDEFVLEVPCAEKDQHVAALEAAMLQACDSLLGRWGVPGALETEVGEHWIH